MTKIEKLNNLLNQLEEQIQFPPDDLRKKNLLMIEILYHKLELFKKHEEFKSIFEYKAMNLSGIGLKNETFAQIQKGKYIQIISIAYTLNEKGKKIPKNSSLGYFGKAERIEPEMKKDIIEFILRWRYEKAFRHTEYYQQLLLKLH